LVNVSGEVVGNGSELIVDEAQAVTSSELSHIGRDCQLTLKLPGLSVCLSVCHTLHTG